jgi:hypothetical protein
MAAAGFLVAVSVIGCAGHVNDSPKGASDQALSNANPTAPEAARCKEAVDDVTKLCAGDNASSSRCNDAKARTRQYCMKND